MGNACTSCLLNGINFGATVGGGDDEQDPDKLEPAAVYPSPLLLDAVFDVDEKRRARARCVPLPAIRTGWRLVMPDS